MRIALLTDGIYPYVIGGMQKHSYFLVKFFARNEIYIDLYHTNQSSLDISLLECFTETERKYISNYVFDFPRLGKFPGHYLRESYAYSSLLYKEFVAHEKPDFIYAKGYTGWKFIEEKQKGQDLPPIGIRLHGYEIFQPTTSLKVKAWNLLYKKLVKFLNYRSDYIYSYGGKNTNVILDNLNVNPEKIIEIPTGIESEWINTNIKMPSKIINFVFVGRYDIRKGIKELNETLNELIKSGIKFNFTFIGPIPEDKKIIHSSISYTGKLSKQEEIKAILQDSDVLVVPSHSEGMPNVITEGMASGCAIIATDVGAVSLLVSKENGLLISPMSVEDLKTSMKTMISMNEEQIFLLKKKSTEIVKADFTWEKVITKEIEMIKTRIS